MPTHGSILDEIKKVPGNEYVVGLLRDRLATKLLIAFAGAGTSAGLYPLWKDLIRILADEALRQGLVDVAAHEFWVANAQSNPLEVGSALKEKLGNQIYAATMHAVFAPRVGINGKTYTNTHAALLRMPFRGIVTTNYDHGLLEARHGERPSIVNTGYATWQDRDDLNRWLTGTIFQTPAPILFAHGSHQRSDTILFTLSEYQAAYRQGLYRRVFEKLWVQEQLVIVGYSFSDPWLKFISETVIGETRSSANEPRHIALIGLHPDQRYTPEMRRLFLEGFNVQVVFYPIEIHDGQESHASLGLLLEQFAERSEVTVKPYSVPQERKFRELWVHETTNDERYVGRLPTLERLDRWAADPEVQIISITGLGGQGKTALVGHWLKKHHPGRPRRQDAVFFWSFYANRAVSAFLTQFVEFAQSTSIPAVGGLASKGRLSATKAAIEALFSQGVIVILDGLEVLQEKPGTSAYGRVLEDDLREFLDAAGRIENKSLVVLTSRFPFADLTSYFGASGRNLDLDRLLPDDGAELLARSGAKGDIEDRRVISRRLEGHPLALRIFAAALATQGHHDPTRLWTLVFQHTDVRDDDLLWRKLNRLLAFYDQHLPQEQRTVLSFVSLFGMPIEEQVVVNLVTRHRNRSGSTFGRVDINDALRTLIHDGLLLREHGPVTMEYSCHPILRDHFRRGLIAGERHVAADAAEILTGRPAERIPTDVQEVVHTLNAIELLLEAEEFRLAHDLYARRLYEGQIFMRIPAIHEGRRCAFGFVATPERRKQCERSLRRENLIRYLNAVGHFSAMGGEPGEAGPYFQDAAKLSTSDVNRAIALRNLAAAVAQVGRLEEAQNSLDEAVRLAGTDARNSVVAAACLSELGFVLGCRGKVADALSAFNQASALKAPHNYSFELASMWEVKHADFLTKIGNVDQARAIAKATLKTSNRRSWKQDFAACHVILGRLDLQQQQLGSAREHFDTAESIFRRGHMLTDLADLLLAEAKLHLQLENLEEAERHLEESLRIVSPRQLVLVRVDGLNLRAQVLLRRHRARRLNAATADVDAALDAADSSLSITRSCGYLWGERDAHALLKEIWTELKNLAKAAEHSHAAQQLSASHLTIKKSRKAR